MQDPPRENIRGEKRHVFEHRIDWSYLVLGAGLLAVAYVAWRALRSGSSSSAELRDAEDEAVELDLTG